MATITSPADRAAPPLKPLGRWRPLLELIGLSGLVVAQPVFSTFQGNATDLVFRRTSTIDLIAFGLLVVLAVPVLAWLSLRAITAAFGTDVARYWHAALCGVFVGFLVLEITKELTDFEPVGLALLALFCGTAFTSLRWISDDVGKVLAVLAVVPIALLATFLFFSPITEVAFADGTAEAANVDMANPASVVLIVFDELPTLSLLDERNLVDAQLWPSFAALAGESTWYRNNSSIAPTTPTAVPAIFTGRLPTDIDVVPLLENHPQNIFTMFGAGHDLTVHESVTRLCPEALCGEAERNASFGSLISDAVDVWWQFASPERSDEDVETDFRIPQSDPRADTKVTDWLSRIPSAGSTNLSIIHSVLPHQPWWRLPDGRRYDAEIVAEGLGGQLSWEPDLAPVFAQQRHLLQLQWTDTQLGSMMDTLQAKGQWDDALVIVTADHGVSFLPGDPIRGLGDHNAARVMFAPMFVKYPGQADGTLDERPTQTIDIVPTILDVLGADSPWPLDGRSMLDDPPPGTDVRTFTEWRLNTRPPDHGIYYDIDGAATYADLLQLPPVVPAGPADLRLWRWGAFGPLVGTPVGDQIIGAPSDLTLTLDEPDAFDDVDLTARPPVYVAGTIRSEQPRQLVAVINGQIVGWNQTKVTRQGHRFWAVAWPDPIVAGPNILTIYELEQQDSTLTLRPVALGG